MKNLMLVLVVIFLSASATVAQERGNRQGAGQNRTPEERAKAEVERLGTALSLNQSQRDSIYKYSLEQTKEQQALFQQGEGDREKRMEQLRSSREKYDTKIKSFLTEDQIKKYEEAQKERTQRRQPRNE
ncbi:hypothetical protein FAZ15_07030 [Sphingobacterium olei]|uniref:DUF4890 domain-containing protein n=1 Tax=Sphingobacterium olei TaxID=2571155 RepID=A0A4U0P4C8_9SPHI|nr:hypothetical protein [Sphingobacterium olei]TJZ62251.1 hypothetical protein FAZ15_07030 [Sphingobacterium olei]